MRALDLPPLWTAGCIAAVWALGRVTPVVESWVLDLAALELVAAALGLMLWAVATMARARTTVWPGGAPSALVTGGPFRLSRNPIYLGDVALLIAAILWTGALAGLVLVPVLMVILTRRFISPEEARLRAGFGTAYDVWAARVRRWA